MENLTADLLEVDNPLSQEGDRCSKQVVLRGVSDSSFFLREQQSPVSVVRASSMDPSVSVESPFSLKISERYKNFVRSFEKKSQQGELLGEISPYRNSNQYCQFNQTRLMAKHQLNQMLVQPYTPDPKISARTFQAMKDFFMLSHAYLTEYGGQFPLANRNKCLGFSVVPGRSLVIIAISQDKDPNTDVDLRQNMALHLVHLNSLALEWLEQKRLSCRWQFELARIPTQEQYLLPRTLSMRSPHWAHKESVLPRTRCVEVALSVAMCKAQRTCVFSLKDIFFLTVGGVIWGDITKAVPVEHFETKKRNLSYSSQAPIAIPLSNSTTAYIDVWDPCDEHCKIYMNEMLAVASAGGQATSYSEPRSESELETLYMRKK